MLKFIKAKEVSNEGVTLNRPQVTKDSGLSGEMLGTMTMLVINRFMSQVKWDDITSIYLDGLVDAEDLALIQRAVKGLTAGGVEIV